MRSATCLLATMTCAALVSAAPAGPPNAPAAGEDETHESKTAWARSSAQDLVKVLSADRLSMVDVTGRLAPEARQGLTEEAQFHGAEQAFVLRTQQSNEFVLCWQFDDAHALDVNAAHFSGVIRYKNLLVHNLECSSYQWQRISEALLNAGGTINYNIAAARAAALRSQLITIRSQIELYDAMHGSPPDFTKGWNELLDGEYLTTAPESVLSTHTDPSRVAVVTEPGATGEAVARSEAGWVWNSTDQTFHAAGVAESELQETEQRRDEVARQLIEIQTRYALNGPQWAKDSVVKHHLGNMRAAMAYFYADRAVSGDAAYPTLKDVQSEDGGLYDVGVNPFNGSDVVQPAKWGAKDPPVFGDAGWNYDEDAGKFWVNSRVAGANEL